MKWIIILVIMIFATGCDADFRSTDEMYANYTSTYIHFEGNAECSICDNKNNNFIENIYGENITIIAYWQSSGDSIMWVKELSPNEKLNVSYRDSQVMYVINVDTTIVEAYKPKYN